jgi:uncharacterized glyoxalase superfamily protein PhnB
MTERPNPPGFHVITPYLLVGGLDDLVPFLTKAFGAHESYRLNRPDGSIMHIEMRIGDSALMMGEPMEGFGPMPSSLYLYVDDSDAVFRRALEAGGESVMDVTTMEHAGERYGGVRDPSGNIWWIATHLRDVSQEEAQEWVAEHSERWDTP